MPVQLYVLTFRKLEPHIPRFNILFGRFIIMYHSEQQARELRGKIEAFDEAVQAAVSDGTIRTLMAKRGKELVSSLKYTQFLC